MADPTPPSWHQDRRAGFHEHVDQQKVFDRERLKGEKAFIEEQEEWERQRQASIQEYKKEKKQSSPAEDGPEHRQHLKEIRDQEKEREMTTREYVRERDAVLSNKGRKVTLTDEEELGLVEDRPRYDVSKRALYGNGPNAVMAGKTPRRSSPARPSNGSRFSSTPAASFGSGDSGDLPPPSLDDGGGYVPPPPIEYDELPPPPPPFDGGDSGDFPPPPDFGDFPPPPPPPLDDL